jgi:hypothetical protein
MAYAMQHAPYKMDGSIESLTQLNADELHIYAIYKFRSALSAVWYERAPGASHTGWMDLSN